MPKEQEIDPKVRGIYYVMLNEHLFIIDPSQNNKRYVWIRDNDAAEEVAKVTDKFKHIPNLETKRYLIAQELIKKLKEEKSNEVG